MEDAKLNQTFTHFVDLALKARKDRSYRVQMGEVLSQLIFLSGSRKIEIAQAIGVHPSSIDRWILGVSIPNQRMVDNLRSYFGEDRGGRGRSDDLVVRIRVITDTLQSAVYADLLELVRDDNRRETRQITEKKLSTLVALIEEGEGTFSKTIMATFLGVSV